MNTPVLAGRRVCRRLVLTAALAATSLAAPLSAAVITDNTFNGAATWFPYSYLWPSNSGSRTHGVSANGTIDSYNGTATNAMFLNANFSAAAGTTWSAGVSTNQIDVTNTFTNQSLLTVSFDLLASQPLPIKVIIRSYTSTGTLTGRSAATFVPPIANAYYRHSIDVSDFTIDGATAFNPTSARFELTFEIAGGNGVVSGWPKAANNVIRVDNVSYTSPKYYVSTTGNNGWEGTFGAPLRTLKEAINRAVPGDVIVVRTGTYTGEWSSDPTVTINKPGSPSRWIAIRNYPGENPVLQARTATFQNVAVLHNAEYIEIRGLTVRGNVAQIDYDEAFANRNTVNGFYNANGIGIDSRFNTGSNSVPAPTNNRAHHIRLIGNTVYENCGAGLSALESDYITFAGNVVHSNSWWTRYASSGMSIFHAWDLHAGDGYRNFVIANKTYSNRCFIPWMRNRVDDNGNPIPNEISDGNGLILDDFDNSQASSTIRYQVYDGRTLVQNNLSYLNGGSGMHAYLADRVLFVNNTAYLNSQSPELDYGQIYSNQSSDVRIVNNIIYAPTNKPYDGSSASGVIKEYNLYYRAGGSGSAPAGTGNTWATPNWVSAAGGNFALQSISPARNTGLLSAPGAPRMDIIGTSRPRGSTIDRGAFEFIE